MTYRLSKTKIMSGRQCPKRLYLHTHHPELECVSDSLAQRFSIGNEVGEIAQRLHPSGILIEHVDNLTAALSETNEVMGRNLGVPVFEGAFSHGGVLIRADVLHQADTGLLLTEVKSSTSVKDYQVLDCAIQAWVMEGAGYELDKIRVAHIDSSFIYEQEGIYDGLMAVADVTEQVRPLQGQVQQWIDESQDLLSGGMPTIEVGDHCRHPFECPFYDHCNPIKTDYPVMTLPYGGKVARALISEGIVDIRDIPDGRLSNEKHARIRQSVLAGRPIIDPELGEIIRALPYPRYYLDFETISFAVPRWLGTSPYKQLPFQWSCHIEDASGDIRHEEFLDTSGHAPMRSFIESLLQVLGEKGPIVVYSAFEASRLKDLARMFPEYEENISQVISRIFDLLPLVRQHYYHPAMQGSWSIKYVLPTIAPELDYSKLEEVQHGGAAQMAYLESISPEVDADRKFSLVKNMLAYCKLDTLAMVKIAEHFGDK